MIVTCPDCETRYQIKSASLKPPGRRVRCQNCDVVWFQKPEEDKLKPTPQSASMTDPEGERDVSDAAPSEPADKSPQIDIETEAARLMAISKDARQQRIKNKKQVTIALSGWSVLAACVSKTSRSTSQQSRPSMQCLQRLIAA